MLNTFLCPKIFFGLKTFKLNVVGLIMAVNLNFAHVAVIQLNHLF
jgi:hypothetical protein